MKPVVLEMSEMDRIGIGGLNPCFIIAEIGQNHQGDVEIAKTMIQMAKECGANCVKFQKSSLFHRFTKKRLEVPYESENSFGRTYGEHRAFLEFSDEDFYQLQKFSKKTGILFTSSCMDIPSANLLIDMRVPFIKIGSGDTNNFELIEHVAKSGIPIILSTGMQELSTVRHARDIIHRYHSDLVILHCVSAYPTNPINVNLSLLNLYKNEFPGTILGYSGHEKGINIALAAVAMGAKVIEKHFTMDKIQKGTDHQCSLDATELTKLVEGIREVDAALGTPIKRIQECEEPCRLKLGKSIVTAKKLLPGQKLQRSDLTIKVSQPMGMRPELINNIIGLIVFQKIEEDTPINLNDNGMIIPVFD